MMIDFLKKKFNFAKGGIITGESLRVEVENNEWIVPMKTMKRMIVYAIIANSKSFRFRFRNLVAVTHCKDCKQWRRNNGIAESPNGHCFNHDIDTNGYDFCSFGERKDNG